jgi:hypothetical protein
MKRNKEFFDKFLHDCEDHETIDVIEFNMGYIPFNIERISDGRILQLNPDNVSYSFKDSFMGELYNKWSWGRLFRDSRCIGAFKPLGWVKIENLESAHKALRKC